MAGIAEVHAEKGQPQQALQLLSQALETAKTNPWPDLRLLCEIAGKYAEAGEKEQASRLLSETITTAQTVEREYDGVIMNGLGALADIAIKFAEIGDFDQAMKTAMIIEDQKYLYTKAMAGIAIHYGKAGDFEQALDMVNKLNVRENYQSRALLGIAEAYGADGQKERIAELVAQALEAIDLSDQTLGKSEVLTGISNMYLELGYLGQAMNVAEMIGNSAYKNGVLADIAGHHALSGDFNQALVIARGFDKWGAHHRARALTLIARAYALDGREALAERIFAEAVETVPTIRYRSDQSKALLEIASEYANAGNNERALDLLAKAYERADTKRARSFAHARTEFTVHVGIAGKYRELGEQALADQLLSEGLDTALASERSDDKSWVLFVIAGGYLEAGNSDEALRILSMALHAARHLEAAELDHKVLRSLAMGYANLGDLDRALTLATAINPHSYESPSALAEIAGKYANAGQTEQAAQLRSQTLDHVRQIRDPQQQSWALRAVSKQFEQTGDFDEVIEIAKRIESAEHKSPALTELSHTIANAGETELAAKLLTEAHNTARTISDDSDRFRALSAVSRQYAEAGDFERIFETIGEIEDANWKSWVFARVAAFYVEKGEIDRATKLLTQALDENKDTETKYHDRLRAIADVFAEMNHTEKTEQILKEAVGSAMAEPLEMSKTWALADIAGVYAKIGNMNKAREMLSHAIQAADPLEDDLKSLVLYDVALGCTKAGSFGQALEIAKMMKDRELQAGLLAEISVKAARLSEQDADLLREIADVLGSSAE